MILEEKTVKVKGSENHTPSKDIYSMHTLLKYTIVCVVTNLTLNH